MKRSVSPVASILLIVANAIPLIGILWLDWNIFQILFLYWLETAIIGVCIVLFLLSGRTWKVLPVILLFLVFYGLFTLAHLAALFAFFAPELVSLPGNLPSWGIFQSFLKPNLYPAIALLVSHGYAYVVLYHSEQEVDDNVILIYPFKRIIFLHLVILVGAWFFAAAQAALIGFSVVILIKTYIDARLLRRILRNH